MRYSNVKELIQLLILFFQRTVLGQGVLKSKLFKLGIAIIGIIYIIVMSILIYIFLENAYATKEVSELVLDICGVSACIWTFVVFVFLKILFIKRRKFVDFLGTLPILRSEMRLAILTFEAGISLIVVQILATSATLGIIMWAGRELILRAICNISFQSILTYLFLELIYSSISYIIDELGLNKVKTIILITLFSLGMLYATNNLYVQWGQMIMFNYLDGNTTTLLLPFVYSLEHLGFVLTSLIFGIIVLLNIVIIINIPEKQYDNIGDSIKLFEIEGKMSTWVAYYMNSFRNIDGINCLVVSIIIYIFLRIRNVESACFVFWLLAMNTIYSYIQTQGIRLLLLQKDYCLLKDYCNLIVSQFVYVSVLSFPFVIDSIVWNYKLYQIIIFYGGVLVLIITLLMMGIIFPPKYENPFSILVGSSITLLIGISFVLVVSFIAQYTIWMALMGVFSIIAMIGISLSGMKKLNKEIKLL